jgi:rubrerythrin
MTNKKIILKCKRCGHIWNWRVSKKKLPKRCPLCKNINWNKKNISEMIDLLIE